MTELKLDLERTALVIVDLQKGVVENIKGKPYDTETVVENSIKLAKAFRENGGFVTLVHVDFLDGKDALRPITDEPGRSMGERPKSFSEIIPELGPEDGDLVVTKNQWGAFFGSNLDSQLRRRGIETIVMTGIATNIGVGATAIEAYQRNYQQVFA
ncbi:MAG TPA: isochorismatase family protein, partial [Bacillales bacterium]|nr:isochorismatase family protein [Bacillales bacterium]